MGCLHFLVVMNNAAMTICIQVLVWKYVLNFPEWNLGVEFLDHKVSVYLIFEELQNCFPQQLHYFTFRPAVAEGSRFSTFSPTLIIVYLILAILVHMNLYLMVVLICSSLMTNDVEHLFHMLIGHLYMFFGEMSSQILCQFFNWLSFYY